MNEKLIRNYINELSEVLKSVNVSEISLVIDCFLRAYKNNKQIFFAGNGGSATTASHFAQDIGEIANKINRKSFHTCCLTDNVSTITAIGNDYGYEYIFSSIIDNLFQKNDVLVVISASGNSKNIVNAVLSANKKNGTTVALTGFDGGEASRLCDLSVNVKTRNGAYGIAEDMHLVCNHIITTSITSILRDQQ